jgi:hypothetical protein
VNRIANLRLANRTVIEVPEPGWCLGRHEDGLDQVDLFHEGRAAALPVTTRRGEVDVLEAALMQYPYASDMSGRAPFVSVSLKAGYYSFDPEELRLLAAGLVVHAGRLRDLAYELQQLRAETTP